MVIALSNFHKRENPDKKYKLGITCDVSWPNFEWLISLFSTHEFEKLRICLSVRWNTIILWEKNIQLENCFCRDKNRSKINLLLTGKSSVTVDFSNRSFQLEWITPKFYFFRAIFTMWKFPTSPLTLKSQN